MGGKLMPSHFAIYDRNTRNTLATLPLTIPIGATLEAFERAGYLVGWTWAEEQSKMTECPRHEGAFDCPPFCGICGGSQEYDPATIQTGKICEECFEIYETEFCQACDLCRCHGESGCKVENN